MRVPKIDSETVTQTVDRNGIRAKFRRLFSERRQQLLFCSSALFTTRLWLPTRENIRLDLERDLLLLPPGEGEGCWNVQTWAPFPGRSGPCRSCFGHPAPGALRRPDLEVGKRQAESASRRASEEGVENCLELTETEKTQPLQLTAGQEDGSSWATNPPNDLQNSFRRQPATQRRRLYSNPVR